MISRRIFSVLLLSLALASCVIPDEFALDLSLPDASHVGWDFKGKWQFFYIGFDPRKDQLKPEQRARIEESLNGLPGATPAAFQSKNVWSQMIRLEENLDAGVVTFPAGRANADLWLVRIRRIDANTVEIETPNPPAENDQNFLHEAGYRSNGEFSLKTPGKVDQIAGPVLVKSWFSNTYSTKFNVTGAPSPPREVFLPERHCLCDLGRRECVDGSIHATSQA